MTNPLATLGAGWLVATELGPADGRMVRVAVIDSGVHPAHPHVGAVSVGVSVDAVGRLGTDTVDRLGHGTAVAAAIREKAPAIEIVPVKVFDRELRTTVDALEAAIDWCTAAGVDLINLSLGTANPTHERRLAQAVAGATRSGGILVAAGEQDGVRWLPGSLRGAVGVLVNWTIPRDTALVAIEADADGLHRVSIEASGYPRPIPGVPPERNLQGTSFAVANATGLLGLLVSRDRHR